MRNFSIRMLIAATVVVGLLNLCVSPLQAEENERPNLVFFLADDQRADFLGCAGHPILKTPNIDQLASQGVRFQNAFVTTSICAASRATLFTGLYERSHKYTFGTIPIAQEMTARSYPTLLREAGYRVGLIGKFGVGVEQGEVQRMFDFYKPLNRSPYFKQQPDGKLKHITDTCGDLAQTFLDDVTSDQPFCLAICFNAPHAEDNDKENHYPWPPSADGLYEDVTIPAPPLSDPVVFESQPEFLKKSMNRIRYFWRYDTPEKYQKNMKGYYRMISGVDHTIGRVMAMLREKGLAENTVVIYSADNGYYIGERGFAGKWSHYEESLRIPLIVTDPRLPENQQGRVLDPMVLNVDVPATILDYAGISVPESYQGRSLKLWVDGQKPGQWRTDFFCEHLMHHPDLPKWEGVRDQRWVYARYFEQEPPFEFLHDLQTDPQQLKNLADDPASQNQLEIMRKRSKELRESLGREYSREKFPLQRDQQKPPVRN